MIAFRRFAGLCAILAGAGGLLYSIAFLILVVSDVAPELGAWVSSLSLMVGAILITAPLIAVYHRLREIDAAFALWALVLGLTGFLGAAIHGGYDLANAINPPSHAPAGLGDLPSQVDPRGLLTFGVAGVALAVVAWLMGRGQQFPKGLSYLGYLLAILLVVLYLGRLTVLDPTSPLIRVPAALTGFLVNPVWYIWLGLVLWRQSKS